MAERYALRRKFSYIATQQMNDGLTEELKKSYNDYDKQLKRLCWVQNKRRK